MWRGVRGDLDGLFFDNLDRLQQDPKSLKHFVTILQTIRQEWPDAHLIGNRGFDHWSQLGRHMDGILFENMTDQAFSSKDKAWVKSQLDKLKKNQVYALDYQTRRVSTEADKLCAAFPEIKYYCAPNEGLQGLS